MRKLATLAFSFAAGIFAAQYLLPVNILPLLAVVCLALGCLGFVKKGTARLRLFLIAAGLAAAFSYNWLYCSVVQAPAERLDGKEQKQVSMTLCGYAAKTNYGAKATVRLQLGGLRGVRAVYYGGEDLLDLVPGSTITDDVAFGSSARIRGDDVTEFTARGVFLLAYSRGKAAAGPGSAGSVRWWPARLGHAMQARIGALFSGDSAGFLTAILTGDKSGLSDRASGDLSEAGLYHLLAVSGMHCAFLLAMVVFLTGRQRRRLVAAAAIPLLLFYMLLAGGTPSVKRACVMLILLLLAPLARRESDPPTALAVALGLILLENPYAAASISLQLSFAAMAGILWLTPKLAEALVGERVKNRAARFALFSVSTTLGALVFTAPLTALYFNILVLISPLSSLLCLWAASLIFCLGLLAVLLSFLWLPLGAALGLVPGVLIRYLLLTAHLLAKLPYHALYFSNPYLRYWLVFLYALFGLAYFLRPRARRKYVLAAALAALTLVVTVKLGALRDTGGVLDITVLNVGQGECVLLSSGGSFALIDCGSGNSWYDPGEIAADSLRSMGCRELNELMLTHYDSDHISGVSELMSRMPVDLLLLPDTEDDNGLREVVLATAAEHGVPVRYVTEESTRRLGSAVVTIYPPLGKTGDNERGLSFLCSAGNYDLLVTGDMDSETEKILLDTYRLPDIEALVVGHHGSKYATSEELLDTLRPEIGIISVGSNSYGHPTVQTLKRLLRAGVTIYRTDLQGNVHISVN